MRNVKCYFLGKIKKNIISLSSTELAQRVVLRLNIDNFFNFDLLIFSSPEQEVVSQCPSCVVRRAASTIALKAYSSYTPGPIDLILGRKHRGDL